MKCFKHPNDAVGVCSYCGRAMCNECVTLPKAPRLTCSVECLGALARSDGIMQVLLDKSAQTARASAFYCYLTAGLSAAGAVAAWFLLPSPFLICFTGGCALVMFASGIWYSRTAKRTS